MSADTAPRIVAFVDDLMDRSRLGAIDGITFSRNPDTCTGAAVVIVDLARHAAAITAILAAAPDAKVVAYGSHVDTDALDDAARAGATLVLARSQFLREPTVIVASLLAD